MTQVKKQIRITLYVIIGVVILLFILSFFLENTYNYSRTIEVETKLECPFNNINNLHDWDNWAPWRLEGPATEITYSNPFIGENAYSIAQGGKEDFSDGRTTITRMVPGILINTLYESNGHQTARNSFKFEELPKTVRITWDMEITTGRGPLARYKLLFGKGKCRKTVRRGLENLKEYCEDL